MAYYTVYYTVLFYRYKLLIYKGFSEARFSALDGLLNMSSSSSKCGVELFADNGCKPRLTYTFAVVKVLPASKRQYSISSYYCRD